MQKARNSRSGSASRRRRSARGVSEHRGGVQVLDPPGPGKFVHVGGDAVDDRSHPHREQQKFIGDSMQNAIPGFGGVELACGLPGQSFKLSLGDRIVGRRRGKRHGLVVAGEVDLLLAADIQAQELRAGGNRDVSAPRMALVG